MNTTRSVVGNVPARFAKAEAKPSKVKHAKMPKKPSRLLYGGQHLLDRVNDGSRRLVWDTVASLENDLA